MEAIQRIVRRISPGLQLLLGALFIYAGGAKLLDVSAFTAQLQRLGVQNPLLAGAAAHYLPFLEIACGFALALRRFTTGAITLYMTLLVVFEAGLAHAWASGVQADCGCFGTLFGGASIPVAFFRNLGLLAIAALVLWRECALSAGRIQ